MTEEELGHIVFDCGENMVKAGFGGDDAPRAVFPNAVGRPRRTGVMVGMGQKDSYVGDEARSRRGIFTIKRPIENGRVANWDDLEKIIHHTFYNELRVAPEEHPTLYAEDPFASTPERQKLAQIMFETFNVPCYLSKPQNCLTMAASGSMSGLSVDFGEDGVNIVPIYELSMVDWARRHLAVGGCDLINFEMKLLTAKGYSFTTTAEREIVRDIMQKLGYIALYFDQEMATFETSTCGTKEYEMPDGTVISVANERFRTPEAFFKPEFIGMESNGLHHTIADVQKTIFSLGQAHSDLEIPPDSLLGQLPLEMFDHLQKFVVSNNRLTKDMRRTVLSGGPSMFPGICDRIQNELKALCPHIPGIKIVAPPERKYSCWIGGSIMTTIMRIEDYISKEEYDETGPTTINWKGW